MIKMELWGLFVTAFAVAMAALTAVTDGAATSDINQDSSLQEQRGSQFYNGDEHMVGDKFELQKAKTTCESTLGGRCLPSNVDCREGEHESPYGEPYCPNNRRCCDPGLPHPITRPPSNSPTTKPSGCGDGWYPYDGQCFKFMDDRGNNRNYDAAQATCQRYGAGAGLAKLTGGIINFSNFLQRSGQAVGIPYYRWWIATGGRCSMLTWDDNGKAIIRHDSCTETHSYICGRVVPSCQDFKKTVCDLCETTPSGGCPTGFEECPYGNCYYFSSSHRSYGNWTEARHKCQNNPHSTNYVIDLAELGNPYNCQCDEWLMKRIAENGGLTWLGAQFTGGQWTWDHSGRELALSFLDWGPSEPSGDGLCVDAWPHGNKGRYYLNDSNCKHRIFYVCQIFNH